MTNKKVIKLVLTETYLKRMLKQMKQVKSEVIILDLEYIDDDQVNWNNESDVSRYIKVMEDKE